MDMTEYATWHVDDVSLAILSTLANEDVEAIAADLDHDTPFMTKWGPFASLDPDIELIEVHAWARKRIIARAAFASGTVFADSTIVMEKPLPATVMTALAGDLVERYAPHPCFHGTRFAVGQKDDGRSLLLDIESRHDLGHAPGRRLGAIVAALADASHPTAWRATTSP